MQIIMIKKIDNRLASCVMLGDHRLVEPTPLWRKATTQSGGRTNPAMEESRYRCMIKTNLAMEENPYHD